MPDEVKAENAVQTAERQQAPASAPAAETKPAATDTAKPAVAAPAAEVKPVAKPADGTPKSTGEPFFKLLEQGRKRKDLEAKLAAKPAPAPAPQPDTRTASEVSAQEKPVSWTEDPDKWEEQRHRRTVEESREAARQAAAEEWDRRERTQRLQQDAHQASQWLLTRSHIQQDPNLRAEVAAYIQGKYDAIANENPDAAARLAYLDVCEAKGITPDMAVFASGNGAAESASRAASGARPSASSGGGKKTWTSKEVEAYLMASVSDPAKYKAREAEIAEAQREGRVNRS